MLNVKWKMLNAKWEMLNFKWEMRVINRLKENDK